LRACDCWARNRCWPEVIR